MTGNKEEIKAAKLHLKKVLAENHGITKSEKVLEAIDNLSNLWKNSSDEAVSKLAQSPSTSELVYGDWVSISAPSYPGRKEVEGRPDLFQYTLGRMSFNIFQPKNILCSIEGITNMVNKTKEAHEDLGDVTYNNLITFTVHTADGDIPAEMTMEGYCYPDPENPLRCIVAFVGGSMRKPDSVAKNPKLDKIWTDTFGTAYSKADQERGYFEYFMQWIMKKMLKLEMPTDSNQRYEMKRIMKGYLDIIYLDETMRITKGNRGSIIIVEK